MYIDYRYFKSLYGSKGIKELAGEKPEDEEMTQEEWEEQVFSRLAWDACRRMDALTTGVDGVRKLKVAFPTDEDDAETVKRCACELVDILYQVKQAEETAKIASGYVETENGLQGKVISSVSAGNESISYAVGKSATAETWLDKALSDSAELDKKISGTIREYLSGISDANGVNLLFMGRYPYRLEK